MAEIGIPLLALLGVGIYAGYMHSKNNPKPVNDGGEFSDEPATMPEVQDGITANIAVDGGAITNPAIGMPLAGSKLPGAVRNSLKRGSDPHQTLKHGSQQKKHPKRKGPDLYPVGLRQFAPGDPRHPTTEDTMFIPPNKQTRATPSTKTDGLYHHPKPMAGFINMQKIGPSHPTEKTFFATLSKKHIQLHERPTGSVPRNYVAIDPQTGKDPPATGNTVWGRKDGVLSLLKDSKRDQRNSHRTKIRLV